MTRYSDYRQFDVNAEKEYLKAPDRQSRDRPAGAFPFVRVFFCYLCLLTVLADLSLNVAASPAQSALDTAALDRFIAEQMRAHRLPGLALVVTHHDRVIYVKGYGASRDGQPVTPETQFFIASLSKSFTAFTVMQLVEAGRIDLDVPVRTYLPELTTADSEVAGRITVRHLLNQTSGLSDGAFPKRARRGRQALRSMSAACGRRARSPRPAPSSIISIPIIRCWRASSKWPAESLSQHTYKLTSSRRCG